MSWYLQVWNKYAEFSGRARRTEYWMFTLFNLIFFIVLAFADSMLGISGESGRGILGTIYQLAVLLPSIAVGVRRMHDTDHSGWWLIVPIAGLLFAIREGQHGENRFGPDPKADLRMAETIAPKWPESA